MASNAGNTWTVASFLASIGVEESDIDSAAAKLLGAGYKTENYLLRATTDSLEKIGIPFPVIDVLLKQQEAVAKKSNMGETEALEIEHDDDLHGYFRHANPPTVSIPSEVELSALSVEDSESSSLPSPTRGYAQELFRNAVRARDKNVCVVTGMEVRPKTHNVQAAHIIGVEQGLAKARAEANILNPYNECNGMLLETSLHTAFDSYQWCMDEFLNIYVSPVGKLNNPNLERKLKGKKINLQVGQPNYPTAEILRVRYALFKEKIKSQEEALIPRKRCRRDGSVVTI